MAHAGRIEYSNPLELTALASPWTAISRNIPALEREPWRALRSSAAIHFRGPGLWREWNPDGLSKPVKDELRSTLEARWAVCVAYWHLQANGGLERAIIRTLELGLAPLSSRPGSRTDCGSKLASELDLLVNGGAVVTVRKSGSVNFLFEMFGEKLSLSAKEVRTLARQFCIAATPEFDNALEPNDRGRARVQSPPSNSLAGGLVSNRPPAATVSRRT